MHNIGFGWLKALETTLINCNLKTMALVAACRTTGQLLANPILQKNYALLLA